MALLEIEKILDSELMTILTNYHTQYAKKIGKDVEIEIRLGTIDDNDRFENGVSESFFQSQVKQIRLQNLQESSQETLDVKFSDLVRVTLRKSSDSDGNDDLEPLETLRKKSLEKVNLPSADSYSLRIGVSEEIALPDAASSSYVQQAMRAVSYPPSAGPAPHTVESIRRKRRQSFCDAGHRFRVDLTQSQMGRSLEEANHSPIVFEMEFELCFFESLAGAWADFQLKSLASLLFGVATQTAPARAIDSQSAAAAMAAAVAASQVRHKFNCDLRCLPFPLLCDPFVQWVRENDFVIPNVVVRQLVWIDAFLHPTPDLQGKLRNSETDTSRPSICVTNQPGSIRFRNEIYSISAFLFVCRIPNPYPLSGARKRRRPENADTVHQTDPHAGAP